jgi:hypothetical protein
LLVRERPSFQRENKLFMSGDYTLSGTMYQGIYVILFWLNEENDLFITHSKYHTG